MVGESFSIFMAAGQTFADKDKPVPVIQIGKPGETGSIEWCDFLVQVQGATAGAVLIEYNLNTKPGSGLWDVHTRIGGTIGSQLQVSDCPMFTNKKECMSAHTNVHVTQSAVGMYMENNWFWTADHDVDHSNSTQVSVYTGRGLRCEGSGHWLWGNGVEHHALYQYQFDGGKDIFGGYLRTETPYYMPSPDAKSQPYGFDASINDPDYATSCPTNATCDTFGARVLNSDNIRFYGAGFYSFFKNFDVSCSSPKAPGGKRDCQNRIFSIEGDSNLLAYGVSEVGVLQMLTVNGKDYSTWSDNLSGYADTMGIVKVG